LNPQLSPKYIKIPSQQSSSPTRYRTRDLYNRRKRLADWIKTVNEDINEPDRIDILKLIEHMQDREVYRYLLCFLKLRYLRWL
jgi:hypothetical protein